jgi:hypothetical protein
VPAWDGNGSSDDFVASAWEGAGGERLIVVVNHAPHPSQCFVRLPFADLGGRQWRLRDGLGEAVYERDGGDLEARGLYVAADAWQASAFALERP